MLPNRWKAQRRLRTLIFEKVCCDFIYYDIFFASVYAANTVLSLLCGENEKIYLSYVSHLSK